MTDGRCFQRYNGKWSRAVQNAIGTVLYCGWLGGLPSPQSNDQPAELGRLLTLEEVGAIFKGMSIFTLHAIDIIANRSRKY